MNRYPTDQDYELLSAYLDGELDTRDRQALEQRLAADPQLQAELDSLRQMIALIGTQPPLTAPRDFTLTADKVAGSTRPSRLLRFATSPAFSALSAAAALFLLFIGSLLVVNTPRPSMTNLMPPVPADVAMLQTPMPTASPTPPQTAPRIQGTPTPWPTQPGMGGGEDQADGAFVTGAAPPGAVAGEPDRVPEDMDAATGIAEDESLDNAGDTGEKTATPETAALESAPAQGVGAAEQYEEQTETMAAETAAPEDSAAEDEIQPRQAAPPEAPAPAEPVITRATAGFVLIGIGGGLLVVTLLTLWWRRSRYS